MNPGANAMVVSRLWLPRPLDPETVRQLLARLASDRGSPTIMLEARATSAGIVHLIGTPAEHVRWVQRTLRDLLPGIVVQASPPSDRPQVTAAVHLALRPASIALDSSQPIGVTTAILSALSAKVLDGESISLQVILGPRIAGRFLRAPAPDPAQPVWTQLARGSQPAPSPVQAQIAQRGNAYRFQTTIRIGATAHTTEKRRRLILGVFGALNAARSPGLSMQLVRERPAHLNDGRTPWRWPFTLTPAELTGLLGWPLGDGELPGTPPLHPRLLIPVRPPVNPERAFAVTALPGSGIEIGISPHDALMHQILLGPTGSGKSNVLLHQIAADAKAGRPMLVIDPKKQLIDDIVERCIESGRADDVVIMDIADPRAPGVNPLDIGDRDPNVVVDGLLAVFKAVFHDGWGPRTEDIFLACLLTLARAGQHHGTPFTLLDLPRLLTDEPFRTSIIGTVTSDPVLEGFWATYNDLTTAAQATMIAAPMNKLRRYLLRPGVRRMLGQPQPAFRLRDLFRENKIVLVPLNEGLIGPITAQLLGSLIVSEAWSATMERASETKPTDRPGFVVVDEAQNFVHLPTSFSDALSQSRSYGVAWVLAHQSRRQLPIELLESIDSNARNKVFFRLESAKDAADAAKLAPGLSAEDFQQLPKHTAYARVVVGGESSGWCAVKTLPPPTRTGAAQSIQSASRRNYGSTPTASAGTAEPPAAAGPQTTPPVVGRKPRAKREDKGGS